MKERPFRNEGRKDRETFRFANHETYRLVLFRTDPNKDHNAKTALLRKIEEKPDWFPVTKDGYKDLARRGYRPVSNQALLEELSRNQ